MITLLDKPPRLLPSEGRRAVPSIVGLLVASSLLLAGLLFAGDARALETNTSEATSEVLAGEATPQGGVSPEQAPPPTEQAPSTAEQTPSPGEQTPVGEESAPAATEPPPTSEAGGPVAEQTPPPGEPEQSPGAESLPPAEQTPPPVEAPPAEPAPSAEPPPAESPAAAPPPPAPEGPPPAVEQTPPPVEPTPPPAPAQEETTKKQPGQTGGEANGESRSSEATGESQSSAGAPGADHRESANEIVPGPSTAETLSGGAAAGLAVPTTAAGESQTSDTGASAISARRIRHAAAAPDAFEASVIAAGSVGRLLGMLGASSVSTIALAAIGVSPASIETGALGRGRAGGAPIESHTSSLAPAPGPDPAPGGAGGGSAAGGGSSASSSASFILVNALRQAAPHVMLRLHVSQPSWHASFCALILERPD